MKLNFVSSLIFTVALSFMLCSCNNLEKRDIMKQGNEVIAKIEAFKKERGRLPEALSEIGVKESEGGPIFYKKKNSSSYEIWGVYAAELSFKYDSETQKWE